MKNQKRREGAQGEYVVGWTTSITDRIIINVNVESHFFFIPRLKTVYQHQTREDLSDFLQMTEVEMLLEYNSAVEKYERTLTAAADRAKHEYKPKYMFLGCSPLQWLLAIAGAAVLTSCVSDMVSMDSEHKRLAPKLVKTQVERFVLVKLDPPKHVYVTLKSVVDGRVYERLHVGKHCNSWRDNRDGDEYNIQMNVYFDPKTQQTYSTPTNLYETFCGR